MANFIELSKDQIVHLFDYTKFDTTAVISDLQDDTRNITVQLYEDHRLRIAYEGDTNTEGHGSYTWSLDQMGGDFEALENLIVTEFGCDGYSVSEIENLINTHCNTIGDSENWFGYNWQDNQDVEAPFYEDADRGITWVWSEGSGVYIAHVQDDNDQSDYDGISIETAIEELKKRGFLA